MRINRRTAIFGSIIQLIVTAMFNQILNTTDALLYGVNTTRLNREFIIRFRELDDNGNLKRARLITGRQFVAMLAEKKETPRHSQQLELIRPAMFTNMKA